MTTTAIGIREVSELTGISVDALRWYEKEGLIPDVERGPDGRRRYSPMIMRWVRTVQALRRTGMPVAEVREFIQAGPEPLEKHERRLDLLERQAEAIDAQLEQLRQDRAVIQYKLESYRLMIASGLDCEDPESDRLAAEVFERHVPG
ncbi:MerR family transcriptional regulator [Kineosporia succinea]|uniref:DNA-binding transcriptional MerR regulator n=1 Tax=Kineosporia succinea TaxID=84632 RepID=A0ABT9P8Q8_9ACTN|nr:MerR family transcriptional regulator [Kineosporia succinea]MDP9828809.1 DNA-binding transcriptional MerR regulator [Kineosporia succinea]